MQHEGSFYLDDVKHSHDDQALTEVPGIKSMLKAGAVGSWLRRTGVDGQGLRFLFGVSKGVLKAVLHRCKGIALDIDAT